MRLGGRLAAAIEVVDDMRGRRRPAADALKDWGLSHRFAGSADRAAIGNIVYDALRRRRSAAWLLGQETPRAEVFGACMLETGRSASLINETLEGDRFAPPPLSSAELNAIAGSKLDDAPPEVRADCPDWCAPLMQQAFGDAWVDETAALAGRPPLDMRANTLLSDRETVLRELAETGARPTEIASQGVRIAPIDGDGRHPNVQAEPAFQKGWFEIQDEGSQIAAELTGLLPGQQALDYCAGGGGKTLALAALMQNQGRITAHDSEKPRLAPIFDRLRRSGVENVDVVARAGDLDALAGSLDLVLIDAPCTGSGTWRRKPDAKWRLTDRQLQVRTSEQAAILDTASRFVRPGGTLAYVTCSVFDAENRDQVEAFLGRNASFTPADHALLWAEKFPHAAGRARIDPRLGIRLSPALSGTDGFYFCALKRQA
jgi:16S rRNA (cytosine967-C5)-methyltransferase